MLSLVQAVARQTLAANPEDFLERFERRVEALAANQDLLVKNAWKGADLDELVQLFWPCQIAPQPALPISDSGNFSCGALSSCRQTTDLPNQRSSRLLCLR